MKELDNAKELFDNFIKKADEFIVKEEELKCPRCGSLKVELDDEWCDMMSFYCDDCLHSWKVYNEEETK